MKFLLRLLISTLAVLISSFILSGVHIQNNNFFIALLVATVIAFLNSVVKPIMILLTIPVTLITFGLFLLIINGFIIILTDKLIDGFSVDNFWWALLFSLILSIVTSILESVKKHDEEKELD